MPNSRPFRPCDLAGRGVLVTRPAAQGRELCRLVEASGGRAIHVPAMAIETVPDPEPARQLLAQPWDLLLFVSRNAVDQALPLFPENRLPAGPRLGAVGEATAKALSIAGRAPDLVPAGRFDSESLLAIPALQDLKGKRVLVVRGTGGRALLGDTLLERGADLAYAEVYRRSLPAIDPGPLLTRWRQDVQLATATSGKILENLLVLVGPKGRDLLLATPLVVVSERTAKSARDAGFADLELAHRASDAAIVSALCRIVERLRDN